MIGKTIPAAISVFGFTFILNWDNKTDRSILSMQDYQNAERIITFRGSCFMDFACAKPGHPGFDGSVSDY